MHNNLKCKHVIYQSKVNLYSILFQKGIMYREYDHIYLSIDINCSFVNVNDYEVILLHILKGY